jgi:mRNA-degrading endonuclease RelE of RelBE toxin-antitoxin system
MARNEFTIRYDPETKAHLRTIEIRYHSLIHETIKEQLKFEPETETRNRKRLRRRSPLIALWELRLGPDNRFRVLYSVYPDQREVIVHGIGVKRGNRLYVAGKEIKL